MRALRGVMAAIAWAGALVATLGAALISPMLMGVAGIVAALAAIVWGLLTALQPEPPAEIHPHREMTGPGVFTADDEELPYRPLERRPTWDTATWGAPE